jgi:hypothetical protein
MTKLKRIFYIKRKSKPTGKLNSFLNIMEMYEEGFFRKEHYLNNYKVTIIIEETQ